MSEIKPSNRDKAFELIPQSLSQDLRFEIVDAVEQALAEREAKGFLEAVEKFAPILKALDLIATTCHDRFCHEMAKESLKSYRRDVLGEE